VQRKVTIKILDDQGVEEDRRRLEKARFEEKEGGRTKRSNEKRK
jgi:hypothetical protein